MFQNINSNLKMIIGKIKIMNQFINFILLNLFLLQRKKKFK